MIDRLTTTSSSSIRTNKRTSPALQRQKRTKEGKAACQLQKYWKEKYRQETGISCKVKRANSNK
jgi:hypothetical protein